MLELFTNLVLETVLYAGAAGVSPVALLRRWRFLDVALGAARPALGDATDRVPCRAQARAGLEFGTLLADTPALAPEYGYYQRLLARDQSEAADLIERTSRPSLRARCTTPCCCLRSTMRSATAWSNACRPTRNRRHRCDAGAAVGRRGVDPALILSRSHCLMVHHFPTARTVARAGLRDQRRRRRARARDARPSAGRSANPRRDCRGAPAGLGTAGVVQTQGFSVVCFADLPPSPSSKTRYLVKRLRAALPELRILVGRWGPPALADDSTQVLRDTGANLVASTLLETRTAWPGSWRSRGFPFRRQTSRTLRSSSGVAGLKVWWPMRVCPQLHSAFVRVCRMLCG